MKKGDSLTGGYDSEGVRHSEETGLLSEFMSSDIQGTQQSADLEKLKSLERGPQAQKILSERLKNIARKDGGKGHG